MAQIGESQPGFRANRRALVGGGFGLAGAAGLAAAAGPVGALRAGAQEATPSALAPGSLRVVGTGSVQLAPDAASVTIGVDVSSAALAEAQALANTTMDAIRAAIAAEGIADSDVQTSNYSVNPIRNYDPQTGVPGEIISFQVTNTVNVKVDNVDDLGPLLDAVVAAGANNIYGINFFTNEPGAGATQAREMAIEDARTRAQELADAAGLTLGRILSISEQTSSVGPLYYDGRAGGQGAGDASIAPGTNVVSANVEVIFELS